MRIVKNNNKVDAQIEHDDSFCDKGNIFPIMFQPDSNITYFI